MINCPICGVKMDETYNGKHYCKDCEERYFKDIIYRPVSTIQAAIEPVCRNYLVSYLNYNKSVDSCTVKAYSQADALKMVRKRSGGIRKILSISTLEEGCNLIN